MTTKHRFISVAKRQFTENGFDRTSIASIADELGLTKQALLHHFGSKKNLYGEVLLRISERHTRIAADLVLETEDPRDQLETVLFASFENAMAEPLESQLLMRELLENSSRAETADTWYLKSSIEMLANIVLKLPAWKNAPRTEALTYVYQLLGAINYFAISQPTLKQMFGAQESEAMEKTFRAELYRLIQAGVERIEMKETQV
jgi:AcrR family transcriptional regulator